MRLIDADALHDDIDTVSRNIHRKSIPSTIIHSIVENKQTIDAVPCKELHALIGEMYYNDGVTMRSLKKLNGMLAKYDSAKRASE